MNQLVTNIVFPIFNKLYKKFPRIYIPLYFAYKYVHSAKTISFIKKWVKKGDVVVDVGANIGSETVIFSKLVGKNGQVHSFEPDPRNFKFLKQTCRRYLNVYLNRVAVGEKRGFVNLYVSEHLNTDHQTFNIGENRKSLRIPLISLDEYFPKNKKVNLIKIDIQGYDYYALLGMKRLLSRSRDIALLGEIWPYAIERSGANPEDYVALIRKIGFKFVEPKKILISKIMKEVNNPYYSLDFIATKL